MTVESETIVMFSHGTLCGRSPSPGENTIVVLCVAFWVSRVGQHGIVALEDGNSCFAALSPYVAIVGRGEFWGHSQDPLGHLTLFS